MLAWRTSSAQCLLSGWRHFRPSFSRCGHRSKSETGNHKIEITKRPHQSNGLSLIEELFPEHARQNAIHAVEDQGNDPSVPRLPLPEVDDLLGENRGGTDKSKTGPKKVTKAAATNAFRRQQLAVLSLDIGSKSLVESDFLRITPKGQHIEDWTGPGDIVKIIPARDPVTLDQAGYYFILFPNPAYARAYQNHVIHLHHMARTHTPTSIESPLPLQPGVIVSGQDAFTLLQDYALCPPSQKLQLKLLSPPYSPNTEQLVSQRGYTQLTDGTDRTGRSVLFWVDGRNLTTSMIKHIVVADGRDQGLAWDMSIEQVDTLASTADAANHATAVAYDEFAETEARRCAPPRWILSFSDESMARRFIRVWHRRPFPSARGHEARLVHAEFIW